MKSAALAKYESGAMSENDLLNFEMRSCVIKRRYSVEPHCTTDMYAYACPFCDGWHKATKRSSD